jgi:radical SAM superfamily enzyme YgiQ (UPF0313 family)
MKKILLVYLPFCTPAAPPYSLMNLAQFLNNNSKNKIETLDLNLEWHSLKFPKFKKFFQNKKRWNDYDQQASEFNKLTKTLYAENNKSVVKGGKPEFLDKLLRKIKSYKPDLIAFSIVYSSQAFYAYALLKELKEFDTVIGGPAVTENLVKLSTHLNNEIEFLEHINGKSTPHDKLNFNTGPDFSKLDQYFSPENVIPIKTSNTCYYRKCTFCSHFRNIPYHEYDLDAIKQTIKKSKGKLFFFIDDQMTSKRLTEISKLIKPFNVQWMCQLKPAREFTKEILQEAYDSGLKLVIWGVESGCDRILKLMRKGTNTKDIRTVLNNSHEVGIKNTTYIMFGFPTETQEEFLETIEFLKENSKNIDLISTATFGLQHGTYIYNNPSKFEITKITEKQRTVLEPQISYEVKKGLTQKEANKMKKNYKKTLHSINKFPKQMNYFREHMLCSIDLF